MTPQQGSSGALLDLRSVSKRFGGMRAVDDVSLSIAPGEIVGLIGPNGAGKTTLFNLVAGNLCPSAGNILLDGRAIEHAPPHRRIAAGLGRTFQIPRPFPGMTVLENVLLAASQQCGERLLPNWLAPGRVAAEEHRNVERAMALLDFMTLEELAHQPARVLSGGQRKLLELARVLMADPKILLLDEPAAGVNPALLETIMDRIAELNRRGVTFLVIEHNMELVSRLCGRALVMAVGRVIAAGAPAEVARDARVVEAYLGGEAA
jgi:branched-chain amino acid transport system ATP-binding protein